jgi:2-iminobutanoate/2-iminopropanoate deaminase
MDRVVIHTQAVASSGKPYSQAIRFGDIVFVSGQVAFDGSTGRALEGSFDEQARKVLDNLRAILEAAGSSLELVLKTTCFLADIADAGRFNEIYREYFPVDPPARSTFQVASLSPGFLVEVEATAGVAATPAE